MRCVWLSVLVVGCWLAGCAGDGDGVAGEPGASPAEAHRHAGGTEFALLDAAAVARVMPDGIGEFAPLEAGETVRQVGLRFDGPPDVMLTAQGFADGRWGEWAPVEVTWREGRLGVGRLLLESPVERVRLRAPGLRSMVVVLTAEITARTDWPLAREMPFEDGQRVLKQAAGPPGYIRRENWGARNPGLICTNTIVSPYRASVHHTAGPVDSGSPDETATMRQIQAFHIDSRGWCDVGYHFVVSHRGQIFEGRRDPRRPAAHVGNQNTGNVGTSLMGNFENEQVNADQFDATVRTVRWIHDTYGVALNRDAVRGHREWPGQATACPGRNMFNRLDELVNRAAGGGPAPDPEPDPEPEPIDLGDTAVTVSWFEGVDDAPGTREGVDDGAAGAVMRVSLRMHNATGGPLRGVRLGYAFAEGLRPVDYVIETDHPGRDGQVWMTNDADGAPDNPAKDAMGSSGALTMYAFGAGESKRVLVDLVADAPTLVEPVWARAWAVNIDQAHMQAEWSDAGGPLQGSAEAVVQARDHWLFDVAGEAEGWVGCGAGDDARWTGALDGALAIDGCAAGPGWVSVDAAAWPEMTLWVEAEPGLHVARVTWQTAEGDAALEWAFVSEGGVAAMVVPLAESAAWQGEVTGLRVAFAGAGAHRVGALYFQDP
ncbi:MAG: peptidoglycan recognition family protein, partial [bacterium]